MLYLWYNFFMEIITSKTNTKIVEAKKLHEKKYRQKTGLFIAETKKVILEALQCKLEPVYMFVKKDKDAIFDKYSNITFEVTDNIFADISATQNGDGYIAVFRKKSSTKTYNGGKFLILDCLQNPDNFGAIIRTAVACDFKQIFVINCVDEYNAKTIRASMGNQFKVDIVHIDYSDLQSLFLNAEVFVADMHGQNIFQINNFNKNTGFVIGNEGNGVSNQILQLVKNKISIPMKNGVESLNASVSASIIMYQIFTKIN